MLGADFFHHLIEKLKKDGFYRGYERFIKNIAFQESEESLDLLEKVHCDFSERMKSDDFINSFVKLNSKKLENTEKFKTILNLYGKSSYAPPSLVYRRYLSFLEIENPTNADLFYEQFLISFPLAL